MTVNEAMLQVAEEYAGKFGYIEVSKHHRIYAMKTNFWGNQYLAIMAREEEGKELYIDSCLYLMPMFEEECKERGINRPPRIHIDMHWGKPRLSVYAPDSSMACLTYEEGVYSEGQAFCEKGPELLYELKSRIDKLILL